PPAPQLQHLYVCRSGLISSDGLWSSWNGQRALNFDPARCRGRYSPIRATRSTAPLIAASAVSECRGTGRSWVEVAIPAPWRRRDTRTAPDLFGRSVGCGPGPLSHRLLHGGVAELY